MNSIVRQPLLAALFSLLCFALFIGMGAGRTLTAGGLFPATAVAEGGASVLAPAVDAWQQSHPGWARTIVAALLTAGGFLLGRATARCRLYLMRCNLPVPLFALVAGMYFPKSGWLADTLILFLTVLACCNLFRSFRNGFSFDRLFRAALYLGILPLLNSGLWLELLLLPFALILFKRSTRESLVVAAGAILPAAACCYICWACGQPFDEALRTIVVFPDSWHDLRLPFPDLRALITASVTCAAVIFAVALHLRDRHTVGTRPRLIIIFALGQLLLTLLLMALPATAAVGSLLLAVPVTLLLPVLFLQLSDIPAVTLYLLCIALALCNLL